MNKLCLVFLGALLFALHLTSQVQAQTSRSPLSTNMSPTANATTMAFNSTMMYNTTAVNVTKDKNGGGRAEVSAALLPLALGILYGWS